MRARANYTCLLADKGITPHSAVRSGGVKADAQKQML